jgi:hypothetical protein
MIGSVCDHELGRSDALRKCERAPRDKRRAAHLGRRAAGCGCRIGMQHDFRIKHLKKRAKIAFPRSDKRCFREFTLAGHITIGLRCFAPETLAGTACEFSCGSGRAVDCPACAIVAYPNRRAPQPSSNSRLCSGRRCPQSD